jgi:hypothetical protein
VYICNDTRSDRCAKQVTKVANILTTTCTIAKVPEAFPGQGDDGEDVEATCSIDTAMQGLAGVANPDLLNVCSFPSGEPNSNPFDCVVRDGAGFIQIVKLTTVTTTDKFGFTLAPASTDGSSKYAVQGGVTTALIPVVPTSGNNRYSLTELLPTGWNLTTASCKIDNATTGAFSATNKNVTGIEVKTGQTTVCTFTNTPVISGPVEYTITVKNNGLELLTLDSLMDDKFANLNGVGTCATGASVTIAGGVTYSCKFTKTLTGSPGTTHTNIVTAKASDNDGNTDTETATATVTFQGST